MGILDYMDTDPEKTGVQMPPVQMEDVPAAAPFNVEAGNTQFQVAPETLAMLDRGKVQAMDVNEAKKIIQAGDFVFNKMPQAQAYDMQAKARAMADAERAQMTGDMPPPPPPSMMDKLSSWAKGVWDDEEQMTKLALAFNTMRLEPDQALAAGLMKRLDKFQTLKAANKSLPMLRKISPELAALVEAGSIDVKDALTIAYKNPTKLQQILDLMKTPEGRAQIQSVKAMGLDPFGGTTIDMGDKGHGIKKFNEMMAGEVYGWLGGGAGNLKANLANLDRARKILESGENVSGAMFGLLPEQGFNIFAPNAKIARDSVRGVVQGTLRETLGAQFTQKEGEGIMDRAYDPALPESENKKRVAALFMKLSEAAQAKTDMMNYYIDNNYSMKGFKPKPMPTVQDYIAAMDAAAPRKTKYIEPEATKPKVKSITEVK